MDFIQLEHFIAVCEEGSFTRASERVFRTQSAVSQSIKKLEEETGSRLLARGVHDVLPTDAGKVVLEYARRMVKLRDETTRQVEALKNLDAGSLAVGANEAAAMYLLPGPLKKYFQAFPDIRVGIYRSRLEQIPSQIIDHELDIGFVREQPGLNGLEVVQIHSDEMVLIARPQHRLTRRTGVRIGDLAHEPFVLHHHCTHTSRAILKLFEQYATPCKIVAELWSFENVKSFVGEGVGVAIVPRITAQNEIREGSLAEIPVEELQMPRPTLMVFRERDDVSEPTRQLINIISNYYQKNPNNAGNVVEPKLIKCG